MPENACADLVFGARSRNSWSDKPVSTELVRELYDLLKLGPTSMNTSPARFRFLMSEEAKSRLEPHLMEGNRAKTMKAPCVAIIGYDTAFYEEMPYLLPIRDGVRDMFAGNAALAAATGFRNGTLQGAYLIVAARMLGLDCGPMSGFDPVAVDAEFFGGTTIKSNFICSLGYADDTPFPRLPRLDFEKACDFL